jgi:predicted outer membrane protein
MDRRALLPLLGGIPAVLIATRSMAQNAANTAPLNDVDTNWIRDTLSIGPFSLAISQIAQKQAERSSVKQFAEFEVAEQTTVGDILKSFDPQMTPPAFSAGQNATLGELQKARGRQFDSAYVKAEMDGHQQLLTIQTNYIGQSGANPNYVDVAKLAQGMINEHLTLLHDINGARQG